MMDPFTHRYSKSADIYLIVECISKAIGDSLGEGRLRSDIQYYVLLCNSREKKNISIGKIPVIRNHRFKVIFKRTRRKTQRFLLFMHHIIILEWIAQIIKFNSYIQNTIGQELVI